MIPIEPLENFPLSRAFTQAAQTHADADFMSPERAKGFRDADAALECNPSVLDVLNSCLKVGFIMGDRNNQHMPSMSPLWSLTLSRDYTPASSQVIEFDRLSWAMQEMSASEREVVDKVFNVLINSDYQVFIETQRPTYQHPDLEKLRSQADENGLILCDRTAMQYPLEVHAHRFWIMSSREVFKIGRDGEPDPTPSQIETLHSTHTGFESAMDGLLAKKNDGSLKRNTSLMLKFHSWDLLQGHQMAKGFEWHKPGYEHDDIPDYYDSKCGFSMQELCEALMEREMKLGSGDRLLEDFLMLDLGL